MTSVTDVYEFNVAMSGKLKLRASARLAQGGPEAVSMSANIDWVRGSRLVLPGGLAVMVVVAPLLQQSKQ